MLTSYEAEQKTLKEVLTQLKADIKLQDDKTANVSAFVEKVKRYTEIKELTPAIVNEFIDYIKVSKKQVINGKTVYPIDIYYNGVGFISAPSAEEYEEMFQERLKQKHSREKNGIAMNDYTVISERVALVSSTSLCEGDKACDFFFWQRISIAVICQRCFCLYLIGADRMFLTFLQCLLQCLILRINLFLRRICFIG